MPSVMANRSATPRLLRTLDLFSGCGGIATGLAMCEGMSRSRFSCVGAIDSWQAACDAFTENLGVRADCCGVSRESVASVLERVGDVDVVTGGPPCQGFSTSGKRALDDPRNQLAKSFLDAIELANPRAFLMENVSGFTTFQDGRLMREVVGRAGEMGFKVHAGVLLASLHGVPQRRRRFIMVGVRGSEFRFPGGGAPEERILDDAGAEAGTLAVDQRPEHGVEAWSFDDATSDLAPLRAGERREEYRCAPRNEYQRWARGTGGAPVDHVAVAHRADFVRMMGFVRPGESAMDPEVQQRMPAELRPTSGFPNSYARIRGDLPSPTITRNFTTPSSANCIHPHADRALSIREGARCQSFPDSFRFAGSLTDRRLMIGNAVPPLLARSLGQALLASLAGEVNPDSGAGVGAGVAGLPG